MKKIAKTGLGLAAVAAVATTGAIMAFAWGPDDRPTYTMENPADHVTFNSITNNGNYGDERNFMMISADEGANWYDTMTVENGKEYVVRMIVHNNAASNLGLVAEDVTARVNLPTDTDTKIVLQGHIASSNAQPTSVWDEAQFVSDTDFNLAYVDGSAIYDNAKGTFSLDKALFEHGSMLGYEQMDGKIPGCNEYAGVLTFRVKAQVREDNNLEITKSVSIAGTGDYSDLVNTKPGDTVRFKIRVKNTGNTTLTDVVVRDILPEGLEYVAGSTIMADSNYPNGTKLSSDAIVTDGSLNIGEMAPGVLVELYIDTIVKEGFKDECGTIGLRNIVEAIGKNSDGNTTPRVEATADVKVEGKVCTENFHVDKMVQLEGEDAASWHETVKAKPGERIRFRIRFFNDGNTDLKNVAISDDLPAGLVYEENTLEVYRNAGSSSEKISTNATLTENKVYTEIDKVGEGEVIAIYFYAHSNGDAGVECGEEKSITNTVKGIHGDDVEIDTAEVVIVTEICEEKHPNFTIDKMVQIDGGSEWSENVTVKPGDKVRYRIQFKNTGETVLDNVVIRDILPSNMEYVAGSTVLYNASGNMTQPGDVTSASGIMIGAYNPGEEANIYFYATVNASLDECQDYILVNTAKGKHSNDDSTEKSDTATVTVESKECTLPHTGNENIVSGLVGVAGISTAAAYYVISRKKLN